LVKVVEASRRDDRWAYRRTRPFETVLTRIQSGSVSEPNETELEEAGARRPLAAMDELNEAAAHDAMRTAQREIRRLDEEILKIGKAS
jgi:hypothetical protein